MKRCSQATPEGLEAQPHVDWGQRTAFEGSVWTPEFNHRFHRSRSAGQDTEPGSTAFLSGSYRCDLWL